jgi:hypothetical protein
MEGTAGLGRDQAELGTSDDEEFVFAGGLGGVFVVVGDGEDVVAGPSVISPLHDRR